MKSSSVLAAAGAFLVLLAAARVGLAAEPTEQIKETTDKILAVVKNPELRGPAKAEEKRKRIRALVNERFDWSEIARRALGRYWRGRTEEEKKEFTSLFARLVEQTYMNKVEDYSGEVIRYTGEHVDGDYASVDVVIVTKKNVDIPVEYKLMLEGTRWLVYDVFIEGVSLVNNYRSQFDGILMNESFSQLVKKLKAKVDEDNPPPAPG